MEYNRGSSKNIHRRRQWQVTMVKIGYRKNEDIDKWKSNNLKGGNKEGLNNTRGEGSEENFSVEVLQRIQLVPAYKEQLVEYCGVEILLRLSHFSDLA